MRIFVDDGRNHTLLKQMVPYWERWGHSIVNSPTLGDVQLTFVQHLTNSNLPKVFRLDGVYYDINNPQCPERNRNISQGLKHANGIIFQSVYAKEMGYKYLQIPEVKTTIIHNGVEPSWSGTPPVRDSNICNILAFASWRRHKRLKEITELFIEFNKLHPNTILHVIGDADYSVGHDALRYYGHRDIHILKNIFNKCSFALYLCKRDCCPNAFLETIGAGIPVITTDACGGATEMAALTPNCFICTGDRNDNEVLAPYTDDYNKVSDHVKEKILEAMENMYCKRDLIQAIPTVLTMEYVAQKYIDFMQRIVDGN